MLPYVHLFAASPALDISAQQIRHKCQRHLGFDPQALRTSKLFLVGFPLETAQVARFAEECLRDQVTDQIAINALAPMSDFAWGIAIAKLAGVTDDEGISAQTALGDLLEMPLDTNTQHIFTQEVFFFQASLSREQGLQLAKALLGNPLIQHFQVFERGTDGQWAFVPFVPEVQLHTNDTVERIDLLAMQDAALMQLSKDQVLALNLAEMKAIQSYYADPATQTERQRAGIGLLPTDCELEILAQTWSEHCKHKEFNAIIHYQNKTTGEEQTIRSLFKSYIKAATDRVQANLLAKGNDWLIKVFSDNAGVVRASSRWLFVWKVETHNSPSALDPYGGAITGILGNNRDPHGTGVGGGRLLFNTNVLCFAPPTYNRPLLTGQLHPRRVMEGVIAGIEDGGNKSGIPTVNGAIVFDDRFGGKPLVYCGTGGLLPHTYPHNRPSWEKPIAPKDLIIMAGGRVGKDGIHGATFSSLEIDEKAPASAVQIGSPITQKKLYDCLVIACERGLIKTSTDNGAGGLSSSIGELAQITNGAVIHLERVPLKYTGLRPWEIFVSESQERMTLVVEPQHWPALRELAQSMEVEMTHIGEFADHGYLQVFYKGQWVAHLSMHFLHEGVPQKVLDAVWEQPQLHEPQLPTLNYQATLLQLLQAWNICSKESVIRRYDHEVKGRSVLKPLMGASGQAPQDAAVVRLDWDTWEGVAVSNGILPRYGDIDAYQMSAGAFDEAVRQIMAVGGLLPNQATGDGIFWSVNDNFCVPDSVFDAQNNPDGKHKLAKLVQMCQALYDMATYFDIPLTSGKDSMKNDFKADGQKIAVPPTILYSMAAKIPDVRRITTAEFKQAGDLIYQLGITYDELGGSELYALHGHLGAQVPQVRPQQAKELYLLLSQAQQKGWIASCHDLSDGGLAVALAEATFGGTCGAVVDLKAFTELPLAVTLFSESHSRFVVSVAPEHQTAFEAHFGAWASPLGTVAAQPVLHIEHQGQTLVQLPVEELLRAWSAPLAF